MSNREPNWQSNWAVRVGYRNWLSLVCALVALAVAGAATVAQAATNIEVVFADNFESGELAQWRARATGGCIYPYCPAVHVAMHPLYRDLPWIEMLGECGMAWNWQDDWKIGQGSLYFESPGHQMSVVSDEFTLESLLEQREGERERFVRVQFKYWADLDEYGGLLPRFQLDEVGTGGGEKLWFDLLSGLPNRVNTGGWVHVSRDFHIRDDIARRPHARFVLSGGVASSTDIDAENIGVWFDNVEVSVVPEAMQAAQCVASVTALSALGLRRRRRNA